ncbi:hypothetical protein HYS00_03565 [Candidatus Microgenomates bacterium]|nr:hypothetical protein [Candidatus Microgenomates bacterium]
MLFRELYDLAVTMGMQADPRGQAGVTSYLSHIKKESAALSPKQKKYFDTETLTNPYSDTRILYGDPKTQVKRLMVGIDAEESGSTCINRAARGYGHSSRYVCRRRSPRERRPKLIRYS